MSWALTSVAESQVDFWCLSFCPYTPWSLESALPLFQVFSWGGVFFLGAARGIQVTPDSECVQSHEHLHESCVLNPLQSAVLLLGNCALMRKYNI